MNNMTNFEQQGANDLSKNNSGLQVSYFVLPGGVSRLAEVNFDRAPDETGVVSALDHAKSDTPFWEGGPTDNFAVRYTGALQVESAGTYTLYLTSDDGSALYLDGEQVIDNDGTHGARTREVTLDLSAGAHALDVLYFEHGGDQILELDWKGQNTDGVRQTIDGAAYQQNDSAGSQPDVAPGLWVAGEFHDLLDHAAAKQGTAVHTLTSDGSAVTLTENGWKAVEGSFEITADTVLTFTFSADVIGEIHGIGFANGDGLAPETFFQFAGTQDWGLQSDEWRYVPGSGAVEMSIRVGDHFTGTFDRIVLGMDDDKDLGADSTFADLDISSAEPAAPAKPAEETPVEDDVVSPGVIHLDSDEISTVDGGRVTNLVPEDENITGIRLLDQPDHGHASVNPDNTISLVMSRSDHVGALDLRYELSHADGTTSEHVANLDVIPGVQKAGWGTGESHYMPATDAKDRVIVEHGDNHRKVYISPTGLTADDISAQGGRRSDFGHTEATALAPDIGFDLWYSINPRGSVSSNWLLLERGGSYDQGLYPRDSSGESPLNPLYIGAWGEGDTPEITSRVEMFKADLKNIVTQDISFTEGVRILNSHKNILFDNVEFSREEVVIQGTGGRHEGITLRNSSIADVWQDAPNDPEADFWSAHKDRESGLYAASTNGLLLEGLIVDHNGWAPDFDPTGATSGGHPPSMYSHNLYIQASTSDVTMRDSTTMQGASFGAQFRGGAYLEDNLFLDNNIAFNLLGGKYNDRGPVGNYSMVNGNLVTSAAVLGADAPRIGALDWGIRNSALLTTLIDNIVTHANDPDDPEDTVSGNSANRSGHGDDGIFTDDTMIWRWGNEDVNVDGLDPDTLNATTIQRYTADLLGTNVATIEDLAQYLRGLDGVEQAAATDDILDYFRAGFGIEDTARDAADTLRFLPDVRGDGVRWDNRLNWDIGDLPGTVTGDSVDLGGNQVVFGGTVALEDMVFGPDGGLVVTQGRLDVDGTLTGGAGATLDIGRAGQLWVNGATAGTETLEITINGGRFANTGTFDSPVTLAANDGQTILASGGAEFRLDAHSRIDIGDGARIGFDGDDDGAAILRLEAGATLGFTALDDGLATLEEFRSGAFGVSPDVQSGIDLGDADLELDLTALTATDSLIFIEADELIGSFGTLEVEGLGNRDAEIIIDYDADTISLQLTEGGGQISQSTRGTEDMVDPIHSDLWEMLNTDTVTAPDPFDL